MVGQSGRRKRKLKEQKQSQQISLTWWKIKDKASEEIPTLPGDVYRWATGVGPVTNGPNFFQLS